MKLTLVATNVYLTGWINWVNKSIMFCTFQKQEINEATGVK